MTGVVLSKRETVLQALHSALVSHLGALHLEPPPVVVRGQDGPERIPAAGLVVMSDGDPGQPEVLLGGPTYIYDHRAEIAVMVSGKPAARVARFDALAVGIGHALAQDSTLGGLCDWIEGEAPVPQAIYDESGEPVTAATIGIVLSYSTPSPLY
jgi:hypothetical protein